MSTIISEINNFYQASTPRNIVVVHPNIAEDTQLVGTQFTEQAEAARQGSASLISFVNFADVDIDYIQNSDKAIVAFTDERDMLEVYCRYVAGLLEGSGFYTDSEHNVNTIASAFVEKIVESDTLLTIMNTSTAMNDASVTCDAILAHADTPRYDVIYQNGRNFSYDLLFFLNDTYPCDQVKSLIIEKFTIHSSEITKDIMQQFTTMRRDLAYILSVVDWMNANATVANGYATDKSEFITKLYVTPETTGNWTIPFYALAELWAQVKDDTDFIAAHAAKADGITNWEYNDEYNEINHMIPMTKKILERTWDIENLSADLKLLDAEIQFFAKRQNRIPYLIHKYSLL